ncbi:hypothetical protein AAG596_04210 [Citromicrobium bathyomarinum]|uniref:RipA family octameric membrane protein n=1 Tax=Citromicrobium TaxID=72173 RepID=UPI000225ED0D|nr:hypothetical protein [Citromicrobium sp. JLT1363]
METPRPILLTKSRYREQLSLSDCGPSESHLRALERAHELRKFEIENYWRRSTYFWGFQFVTFGALALSSNGGDFDPALVLVIAVLGALAAWTAILSARGSKFWQENWEKHVDFLEDEVEGRLHKTALLRNDVSYSVSRVNERFLELLFTGWLVVFAVAAGIMLEPEWQRIASELRSVLIVEGTAAALIFGLAWLTCGQKSKLRGRAFRYSDMTPWKPRKRRSSAEVIRALFRRIGK